jgi:hypothetical protein
MIGEILTTAITIAAMVPIFGICAVIVMWWTVGGDISPFAGILTLATLIFALFLSLMSKSPVVQGITIVGMLSLLVMFKFAENYLDRHDLREINAEHIDRAILELSIHPDNFPAWFKLCSSLFEAGYHGHAIALAEQTIERIPNNMDPINNRSMREMYRNEEYMIKKWRGDATDPKRHLPIACPKCGQKNRPGTVNCTKCEAPYLLLLSRKVGTRTTAFAKLVLGWAFIAGIIPAAAFAGEAIGGGLAIIAVLGGIAGVGVILYWIFRDPSGQPERLTPFS